MQSLQSAMPTTLESSTSSPVLSPDGAPVPVRWVEDLFARLAAILGGAMSNVYASADPQLVKAEWAEALGGFSADEVKRGINATRTRKFPPNLPEFLHLCRPALDPETAWIEAEAGMRSHGEKVAFAWSHPAVYWAARELQYELRTSNFAACRKRWEAALGAMWALRAWPTVPDPTVKALEHSPRSCASDPARRDAVLARLQEQRRQLTGYATRAEQDAAIARAEQSMVEQGGAPC